MRYLVVLDHTLGGTGLSRAVYDHAQEDDADFHVVVPTESTETEAAARRLDAELELMRSTAIEATGEVATADPMEAIRAAVSDDTFTGMIVATQPLGLSRWIHLDLPHKVEREFKVPVEWMEAETDDPTEETAIHFEMPRAFARNL